MSTPCEDAFWAGFIWGVVMTLVLLLLSLT